MKYYYLVFLILFLGINTISAQEYFYYGSNGKILESQSGALLTREVDRKSDEKALLTELARTETKWEVVSKEKITRKQKNTYRIKVKGEGLIPKSYTRTVVELEPGLYQFTDTHPNGSSRLGTASSLLPLHLEGLVEEFFPSGKRKSYSEYSENQLIYNRNWLPDGSRYIDTIFYSVDTDPEYLLGDGHFNQYILSRLEQSGFDFTQVEDVMQIAWVVMEDGSLDGALATKGKSAQLRRLFVEILSDLPGDWEPGILDGKKVRTYMSIPIYLSSPSVDFQEMDLSNNQLRYVKY